MEPEKSLATSRPTMPALSMLLRTTSSPSAGVGASFAFQPTGSAIGFRTTGKLDEILSGTEDLRHHITIPHAIRAVGISAEAANSPDFIEALQRIRLNEDRYRVAEGTVQLAEETLFRTDVALPANLTEGNYKVGLFILRGGKVIDSQERLIGVRKAGLERFLFNLAHQEPFLYGVISLAMAAFAGWAASAAFRFMRS